MVRSHLKYAIALWNPYREWLIKDLEWVQMMAVSVWIEKEISQGETHGTETANFEYIPVEELDEIWYERSI